MPTEPSLSMTYDNYLQAVSFEIGWGLNTDALSTDQVARINLLLAAGLRQFYYPPPMAAGLRPHEWSFLRPVTTITTVADQWEYDLPSSFGGMDGPLTYAASTGYSAIKICGENKIRKLRQTDAAETGVPRLAAIRVKEEGHQSATLDEVAIFTQQRQEMLLWPTPSDAWVLTYMFAALTNAITEDFQYALGGMQHAETIRESILAVVEREVHNEVGLHNGEFQKRLAASIAIDIANGPEYIGYNTTRNPRRRLSRGIEHGDPTVTYEGS